MNYESKARPITTVEELEAAIAAGAKVEFTSCGTDYDLPAFSEFNNDSLGWVPAENPRIWFCRPGPVVGEDGFRLRAFYPVRASLLSRLAFWRTTA
ncbi:hypothetical protein [Caldimonas thermodepolymerans]|uniref:hypothetical protein n=1 Tax=Caldimonas thermodepolymerans TaxID=215580 RepID=UPI00249015A2|nr:hypothetical protein [Caldimonas thermodepolymerans]